MSDVGSGRVAAGGDLSPGIERMQTVAGQDEARRDLLATLSRAVAESAKDGLRSEHIVTVLTSLLTQEGRLLDYQRVNERSY